ncbi:MAG: N-6 DNA methylase [Armatimonadota bacterium]|nr:N-6 DNA methylase [Armatimonadota bacterium]
MLIESTTRARQPSQVSGLTTINSPNRALVSLRTGRHFGDRALAAAVELCRGSLQFASEVTPEDVQNAFSASRILSLRLAALLFARARGLLTTEQETALDRIGGGGGNPDGLDCWNEFIKLSQALANPICGRSSLLDAGLFDDAVVSGNPFPETQGIEGRKFRVSNSQMRWAYQALAGELSGKQVIDYGEAPVTLLGSAYEVLMDAHPELIEGAVTCHTEKAGRKAAGKFYTPPALVDYIVRNTLGTLVQELSEGASDVEIPGRLLSMRVLDPALGCGDFLIAAARFIGNAIADRLGSAPGAWVRLAAQRCVYGVDSDPIAVAVAKTALWLDAGVPGEACWTPANIRHGNSLIGACLHDLGLAPDTKRRQSNRSRIQPDLFQGHILARAERFALTSKPLEGEVRDILDPLRKTADVWISGYAGVALDSSRYMDAMLRDDDEWFETSEAARLASTLAADKSFFHWDMEFPEVFLGSRGFKTNPGFDAVIGNPPYVAGKNEDMGDYQRIHGCYGQSDHYLLFLTNIIRLRLVRQGGYLSMVLPDPFLVRYNAAAARRALVGRWTMKSLLHIKDMFPGAGVSNIVPVCRNCRSSAYKVSVRRVDSPSAVARFVDGAYADYSEFHEFPAGIALAQPECEIIYLAGLSSQFNIFPIVHGTPGDTRCCREPYIQLGEMDVEIYRGEEIGKRAITLNEGEFPVLLGGQSIHPFRIQWEGRRMDSSAVKKPLERYLDDKIMLQKSAAKLTAALDLRSNGHLGYIVPQSVYCIRSGDEGPNLYYLLALLNSSALNDYIFRAFTGYKFVQPQIEIEDLKRLPVRCIVFKTPIEDREDMISFVWNGSDINPAHILNAAKRWLDEGRDDLVHDLIVKMSRRMVETTHKSDSLKNTLDRVVCLLYGLTLS